MPDHAAELAKHIERLLREDGFRVNDALRVFITDCADEIVEFAEDENDEELVVEDDDHSPEDDR